MKREADEEEYADEMKGIKLSVKLCGAWNNFSYNLFNWRECRRKGKEKGKREEGKGKRKKGKGKKEKGKHNESKELKTFHPGGR